MFFQLLYAANWCKELTIFMRIDYFSIPSISSSGNNRPKRSCGQGNIFTPVCQSVHRGVFASVHAGIPTPLGADNPLGSRHPWSRHPLSRHPPWEQTPPRSRNSPGADTPRADTPQEHPTVQGTNTVLFRVNIIVFSFSFRDKKTIVTK